MIFHIQDNGHYFLLRQHFQNSTMSNVRFASIQDQIFSPLLESGADLQGFEKCMILLSFAYSGMSRRGCGQGRQQPFAVLGKCRRLYIQL